MGGRFDPLQKEIYETVLDMQLTAIAMIRPGVSYRSVHLKASEVLVERLKELGLMKGSAAQAVAAGAHALFFPHGLGHMMGLDVHDMEDLGETWVGYDEKTKRSQQFGLAYLRLAKKLEPGHVLTVEPGIYFIPALIDQWRAEKKHSAFINYAKVDKFAPVRRHPHRGQRPGHRQGLPGAGTAHRQDSGGRAAGRDRQIAPRRPLRINCQPCRWPLTFGLYSDTINFNLNNIERDA